jgi:hypothetical protein
LVSAPPGSEELAVYTLLNNERLRCGFGALTRNAALDAAARGHANWLLLNNYTGHTQIDGTPGYTGVDAYTRALTAGYSSAWIEDESTTVRRSNTIGYGEKGLRTLLSAPYHLQGMVAAVLDIGISVMGSDEAGTTSKFYPRVITQINLGYLLGAELPMPAVGAVLSYPCEGTTGTFAQLSNESPNPAPGRDLSISPVGHPLFLVGDPGKTLTISSTLMQETVTGNTVSLLAPVIGANDPNHFLQTNQGFVLPDSPLKTNTQYRATIVGTNDGVSFTKTFNFTTGALADATDASL